MLTKQEIQNRIAKLIDLATKTNSNVDTIIISSKVSLYYFTGTMQNGLLFLFPSKQPLLAVRKSYIRAKEEALVDNIIEYGSYKDIVKVLGNNLGNTMLETDVITLADNQRLTKYFTMDSVSPVQNIVNRVRSVKSDYELAKMKKAGSIQNKLYTTAPNYIHTGMTEFQIGLEVFNQSIHLGHNGVCRMNSTSEQPFGQFAISENSLVPTDFDGPDGMKGRSASEYFIGSDRVLNCGDIFFLDSPVSVDAYHADSTRTFACQKISQPIQDAYNVTVDILNKIEEILTEGAIPSQIYKLALDSVPEQYKDYFMGFAPKAVRFIGHSIGLNINDGFPVLAKGFDEPLVPNTTLAIEPKIWLPDIGMVGIENTYIVTNSKPISITGTDKDIIIVE